MHDNTSSLSSQCIIMSCSYCQCHQKYELRSLKRKDQYSSSWGEPHLRAMGCQLRYGITQCYLPPETSERPRLTPAIQAGTRFTYSGGMEG